MTAEITDESRSAVTDRRYEKTMHRFSRHSLFLFVLGAAATAAHACDLCGCYTPQMDAMAELDVSAFGQTGPVAVERGNWLSHVYVAIAEQFTHFGTLQLDGSEIDNPTGQYLDS